MRAKPCGQHLGNNNLCDGVDKSDRLKVENLLRTILFGEEYNDCRVQVLEVLDV